jgi:hypothetical protein
MWKYDVVARHHGEAANVFGLINEQNTKWPSRCLDLILRSDGANRRFEFDKRRQFFIRSHNETLSVAAIRVSNEHSSSRNQQTVVAVASVRPHNPSDSDRRDRNPMATIRGEKISSYKNRILTRRLT